MGHAKGHRLTKGTALAIKGAFTLKMKAPINQYLSFKHTPFFACYRIGV